MDVKQLRNRLEQQKGKKIEIENTVSSLNQEIRQKNKSLRQHEQAREVIRTVGLATQEQLQYHISDITSLALESIFEDPYELAVEFLQRRNKTECDLYFQRDGNKIDPMTASGVGAVDVAAFALRIASWSMQNPHSRNTIIMDEPFRFLSEDYQEQASEMLKEISKRLGIQFIIVTHNPTLTSFADKVFEVTKRNGVSKVKEIA